MDEIPPREVAARLGVSRNALKRNGRDRTHRHAEIEALEREPPEWLTCERLAAQRRAAENALPRLRRRTIDVTFRCGHDGQEEIRLAGTRAKMAEAVDLCLFYAAKEPCEPCAQAYERGLEPPAPPDRPRNRRERREDEWLRSLDDEQLRELMGHTPLVAPGADPIPALRTAIRETDETEHPLAARLLAEIRSRLEADLPELLEDVAHLVEVSVGGNLADAEPGMVVGEALHDPERGGWSNLDSPDRHLDDLVVEATHRAVTGFLDQLRQQDPRLREQLLSRLRQAAGDFGPDASIDELIGYLGDDRDLDVCEMPRFTLSGALLRVPLASLPGGPSRFRLVH